MLRQLPSPIQWSEHMKKIFSISALFLLAMGLAHAEIPKAQLSVNAINPSQWPAQFVLTLTVPEEHHAYLDKGDESIYIPIAIDPDNKLPALGLAIDTLKKPEGVHDAEVKATVLRGKGDFTLSLTQTGTPPFSANSIPLDIRYQLCNEQTHVCFRPQTTNVDLNLAATNANAAGVVTPPATAPSISGASTDIASNQSVTQPAPAAPVVLAPASPVNQAADDSTSIMDKLVQLFERNKHNTLIMFGLMFIAGVLSVATPCVYPMLPITSMFIVNRAAGVAKKEKYHAFVYLVGMVGTYMALGLIAGMTGGAFNTFMQSAAVNIVFALFFAFFAIALLGFYELAFMQNEVHSLDQHSAQVKGLAGTWLMGTVAGLVISPCVGPIVFALLLQVADNIADKAAALALMHQTLTFGGKLTIALQGSVMMAGFGLGVGLPFFAVSVIKFKKLPRAGYWMNKIKYAFGFMILYFAYVYLGKGLGVLGVDHPTTLAFATGLVFIWVAVVHCNVLSLLPKEAQPNHKMHHYLGIITLIIGAWLVVASLGKMPLVSTASANTQISSAADCKSDDPAIEKEAGISWHRSFDAAQKVAKETHKPIFIDFYASWCANCAAFKEETANNVELNKALREKAVAVKLVDQEPEFEAFRANPEHRQLKIGLPYFTIISPEGRVLWSGTDYKATEKMVAVLSNWAG